MRDFYTLLYCTCDKYDCLWNGFFKLLKKYWPDFNSQVVLNTEEKVFEYPGISIKRPSISMTNLSWSERLLFCLQEINTPYILFVLDDFYLKSPVDCLLFQDSLQLMNDHSEVGLITFAPEPGPNYPIDWDTRFEKRGRFASYRVNAQIGLWRKDYLMKVLRSYETPWQFELNGSFRSSFMSQVILALKKEESLVFDYDWGFLMIRGEINPALSSYFEEKEGISIIGCPSGGTEMKTRKRVPRFLRLCRYGWDMITSLIRH